MTEIILPLSGRDGFLRRVHDATLPAKVRCCEIRKEMKVQPLLRIERSQLRWFSHVSRMSQERLMRQALHGYTLRKAA